MKSIYGKYYGMGVDAPVSSKIRFFAYRKILLTSKYSVSEVVIWNSICPESNDVTGKYFTNRDL